MLNTPLAAAMFTRVLFPLAISLDGSAVKQEVQWPGVAPIPQAHILRLMAAAKRIVVWHRPVHTDQPKQALDEPNRLFQRQTKQHLNRQTGLNCDATATLLPTVLAVRWRSPIYLGSNQFDSDLRRFKVSL